MCAIILDFKTKFIIALVVLFIIFKTLLGQNCRVIIEPINDCDEKYSSQQQSGNSFSHSVSGGNCGPGDYYQMKGTTDLNGNSGFNGEEGRKGEFGQKGLKGDAALAELFRLIFEIQSNITNLWNAIQSMNSSGFSMNNSDLSTNHSGLSMNHSDLLTNNSRLSNNNVGQSMKNSDQQVRNSGISTNHSGIPANQHSGTPTNNSAGLSRNNSGLSLNSSITATPQSPSSGPVSQAPTDGDWTIFQKRYDGSVDFQRNWNAYKNGFGDLKGEFWLGLERLYEATIGNICYLRVDLWSFDDIHAYAEYSNFYIESETNLYRLHVGRYSGTAGNSLTGQHSLNNMPFTTIDRDNDRYATRHCSLNAGHGLAGGWWFNQCAYGQLNAEWGRSKGRVHNIFWKAWKGESEALKATEMKYRCD